MAEENVVPFRESVKTFRHRSEDPRIEVLCFSKVSKSVVPCSFRASMVRLEGAGVGESAIILQDGTTITLALPYAQMLEKIDEGYSPVDLKEYCKTAVLQDGATIILALPDAQMLERIDEGRSRVDVKECCKTAFPAAQPQIGARMADGSVFAGRTSDGRQICAMPNDLGVCMTFNDAAKAVTKLNNDKALGHDDWHIPSLDNLCVLYENKNEGALKGTFTTGGNEGRGSVYPDWYWSSTEVRDLSSYVHDFRFSGCSESWHHKNNFRLSCRPVRLVDAKQF